MDILVHISAPTSNRQDERHREQARNYVAFQSQKRRKLDHLGEVTVHGVAADSGDHENAKELSKAPQAGQPIEHVSLIDDTQLAISALESQIITSSIRAALADAAQSSLEDESLSTSEAGPLQALVPSAPRLSRPAITSNPEDKIGSGDDTTELSVLVPVALAGATRSDTLHADSSEISAAQTQPALVAPTALVSFQSGSSSWSDDNLPVELPSTYSISDETPGDVSASMQASSQQPPDAEHHESLLPKSVPIEDCTLERATLRPLSQHTSANLISGLPHGSTANPPLKESTGAACLPSIEAEEHHVINANARAEAASASIHHTIQRLAPDAASSHTRQESQRDQLRVDVLQKSVETQARCADLPLTIQSPVPPTGISAAPATFVTDSLQSLIKLANLQGRYRPLSVSRVILPQERGYWSFDPSRLAWSSTEQKEMWVFLARMIGAGHAGWGVWIVRTAPSAAEDAASNRLGRIRIFCWGEIVEHMWLLLYAASTSKIKKAKAAWHDASGEVVVQT